MALGLFDAPSVTYPELLSFRSNALDDLENVQADSENLLASGSGYILLITFAEEFEGCNFTITGGGESKTSIVGESLIESVTVRHANTEYTITCGAYSNTVVTGDYFGKFAVELSPFMVKLTVTTNASGATVTANTSGKTVRAIADIDGQAVLTLTKSGVWTVTATTHSSGVKCKSNTALVTAESNGVPLTSTLSFTQLDLTAPAGAIVTLANETVAFEFESTGLDSILLPSGGDWTVMLTDPTGEEDSVEEVFTVTANTVNSLELDFFVIYGVELSGSTWQNIDKNGNVIANSLVKTSKCLTGIHDVTVDGQAMVEIPKFHFLYQKTNTGHRWWVAPRRFTISGVGTSQVHKGFVYSGVEKDCFQIGAYEASIDTNNSNKNASVAGKSIRNQTTYADHLVYCQNRGNGFTMQSYYHRCACLMLMLVDLGSSDALSLISNGYPSWSATIATGASNCNWRGIHEFWGCNGEYCTGFSSDNNGNFCISADAGATSVSIFEKALATSNNPNLSIQDISIAGANQGLFLPIATGTANFVGHYRYNSNNEKAVLGFGMYSGASHNDGPFSIDRVAAASPWL